MLDFAEMHLGMEDFSDFYVYLFIWAVFLFLGNFVIYSLDFVVQAKF